MLSRLSSRIASIYESNALSEIRMFRNGAKGVGPESPLGLGHELAGVVEKAGRSVAGIREGQRVAVAPNMGCGTCDACISGNTHFCENGYRAFGINLPGGFAEFVLVPAEAVRQGNLCPISAEVSFAAAALAGPLSCVFSAFQRCAIRPGDRVLIIDAGPIGLMHAKLARMGGAAKVILNDLSTERLEAWKIPVEPFDSPLGIAGIALLVLGALTRSWAAGYIRKAKELATTGPYALSRNPLYLGAAFMLAGVVCLVPDLLTAVVLAGVFIVLYWTTIRSEEEFLHGRFGKQWEDYIAGSSRFFPFKLGRIRAAFEAGWSFPQWLQNRGWGVYLSIAVLLLLLWVYRVYLR